MTNQTYKGGCLCGAVRYEVNGSLRDIIACHCEQCRRASGHYVAATAAHPEHFRVTNAKGLVWFASSPNMRRGFCNQCGSTLFFDHGKEYPTGITAGSLDDAAGLRLAVHIWVNEAGDYYELNDGVPQVSRDEWRSGEGWDGLHWTDGTCGPGDRKTFNESVADAKRHCG